MTKKISELSEAVLPLTGAEEVLLVQAGITSRAAASALALALFAGVMTPADLGTGTTNDLTLADILTKRVVELTSSGNAAALTGIADGVGGMVLLIVNAGSFDITLSVLTGSAAGNQFSGNGDKLLTPGSSCLVYYSDTLAAWSIVGV